jgi:hypothetical protein
LKAFLLKKNKNVFCVKNKYTFVPLINEILSLQKILSKKSIFVLPILALVLLVNTGFAKINGEQNSFLTEALFHKQENHNKDLNVCNVTSLDEVEIVFSEIEAELEFELKWGAIPTIYSNFLEAVSEKENHFSFLNQFKTNQKVPLYDLFCNWKLHLS